MMTRYERLEMAAAIQEADDVYATDCGFGICCVKNGFTRYFLLDEVDTGKFRKIQTASGDGIKQA